MKALINNNQVEVLSIQPAGARFRITYMETVEHEGEKAEREVVAFITKEQLIVEPTKQQ